jgi:hypothetical protein
MGFLDAFNSELEKQIDYFIDKEDYSTSKRSQTMMFSMDKIAKTLENSFENGSLTPEAFLKQMDNFISIDTNTLNTFKKIKFGKGVQFVQNRLVLLKADRENLKKVVEGEDF